MEDSIESQSKQGGKSTSHKSWLLEKYKSVYRPFTSLERVENALHAAHLELGSMQNIELYNSCGYELLLDSIDMIVTTCKLTDTSDGTESVYGFIYSMLNERTKINSPHDIVDGKISFKYYSVGPSHISRDGEYKGNFTSMSSLLLIKEKLPEMWRSISEYAMHHFYRRKLQITTENFYPTNKHALFDEALEISIRKHRFPVDLFVITWYMHVMYSIQKTIPQNINTKLNIIFQKHMKDDVIFILNAIQLVPDHSIQLLHKLATEFKPHVRFGQKLIPLNLAEVQNPFNLYYKPWREYIVSAMLSDLAVNNICGSFPIVNRWIYMRNIKKGLFDNAIQFEKLDKSDLTKEIINVMVQAHKYTTHITEETKNSPHEGASWLENRFVKLGDSIKNSIDYAKRELIMSDSVLGLVMERVNYTFFDMLKMSHTAAGINILKKENAHIFVRYIFEICYALYCMSSIYGIIHADLHLNNVSIKNSYASQEDDSPASVSKPLTPSIWTLISAQSKLSVLPEEDKPKKTKPRKQKPKSQEESESQEVIQNPLVMYVVGDDADEQFLFETNGYNACVFDFSRCIMHPAKALDIHLPSLPKAYAPVDDLNKFTRDQIEKMVDQCILHFSDYADKRDDLFTLFKNNFDACFLLMTAIDIYSFTQKLLVYFQTEEKHMYKGNIELLEKINSKAAFYLTTELNSVFRDPKYAQKVMHIEKPMLSIIKEIFDEYNSTNFKSGTIIDLFVFNQETPYSLNKSDKFPPYLIESPPKDKADKYAVSWTVADHQKNLNNIAKFETKQLSNLKMIEYIANRHGEKYF